MNEYDVKGAEWFDLEGPSGPFRIFVYRPQAPEPETGFPVVYALDGNAHFMSLISSMKAHSVRPHLMGLDPAVIVGIGYPIEGDHDLDRRSYDYTPPVDPARLGANPDGLPPHKAGGAEEFLAFLNAEIRPTIEAMLPLDSQRQSLFGHSYGGLFTLFTALTQPHAFQNFLASSPSIWFGEKIILSRLEGFRERLAGVQGQCNLFLSVGALEQTVPPSLKKQWPAYADWIRDNNMVGNLEEFHRTLENMALPLLQTVFHEIAGEHHGSVPPVAIHKAIPLALRSRVRKVIFDEIPL